MKIFTKAFPVLILTLAIFCVQHVSGQSILDPTDSVYTYSSSATKGSKNNPNQPASNTIAKWVRTVRMSWNTNQWKCYVYNQMPFRLIFPKSYNPTANDGKKYPVLVFYHGAGELGTITDNELSLAHGGNTAFQPAVNNGVWDGYILVPQSPFTYWDPPTQIAWVKQILDYMIANNKVDPFHIIANGLSAGGGADWASVHNYPQVFCAAPIFSNNAQGNGASNMVPLTKFLAIWDFQGGLDAGPSPYDGNIVNQAMIAAGANYKYTLYPDLGHGTWDRAWAEPDFWPFCNRAYGANPWPLHGQTLFCPGVPVVDTLGVAPGFDAYQWRKNGTLLSATGNWIIANDYGTYDCRVQRNGIWSDWSHTPVVIGIKQPTITPPITVAGLESVVIPALDNPGVTLQLPAGYATYAWQKVGNSTTLSTTNTLTATTPGQYIAEVTETGGCSANWGSPFTVIDAKGPNAPDPASGVLAAPLSQTSVLLNWSQNPTPGYNETGFEIYQGTKSGGPYNLIAITGADASKDTITGLNPATKYFWVIRAVNGTGASATSNEASATTIADMQPPTAPGNLTIAGTTYNGVSLQWNASSDNVGVTAYDVYVNGSRRYSLTPDNTSFTVYSLTNGSSYTFAVKARDLAGNVSNSSNQVSGEPLINGLSYSYYNGLATTLTAIPDYSSMTPAKTGFLSTFSLSPQTDGTYFGFLFQGFIIAPTTGTYQFQITSDDGSRLYLGSAGSFTSPYSFSGTPLINNDGLHGSTSKQSTTVNLVAGQFYPIAATYLQMTGGSGLTVSWKTPGSGSYVAIPASALAQTTVNNGSVPAAPSNLVATTLSYKAIGLQWKDNANNETGYEIYRATDSAYATAAIIGNAPAGATAYVDSTLAAGTTYYYQVRAINQYGASIFTSNYREARFQFNNTLVDSTGNGRTITPTGTVTYDATNKQEGAASLKLNGSNQAETLNSTGGFLQNAFNQRTVALWIKAASFGSNRVIFDIGGSTNGLALVMNNTTLTAAIASGGTRSNITYSYGNNTSWHHVAVAYLGDTLQLYVDGNLVASNNSLSFHSVASTTDGARLGQTNGTCALNNANGIFSGNMDDFGVFNTSLSPDVIATVMNSTFRQSNATTQALPAVPAAPTNLVATATSSTGVKLTWQDNSTNETSFQVYRSNNNNQAYVLVATLPAGSASFQDSGLFASATYYYKVDAYGIGGQSAPTNEASVKTPAVTPGIMPIANQQARYGTTTVIPVQATSASGSITLSASNLPAFAVLTDNHNGTGSITLNPASSDAGNYTGLTVTATNSSGGSASTSFNLAINNNYAPTLDSIGNYSMNTGDSISISLHGANVNPSDTLTLVVSNLPIAYTLTQNNGTGTLTLKPGYAADGNYTATVTVNDNNGLSTSRTFNVTVIRKSPVTKVYARVQYLAVAPAPWNNMTGTSTSNLKDANGNTTSMSVNFSPSNWWAPYNAGTSTGNNSGVYPDVVMSEYYYFGFFDGPATASFTISGLDTTKTYDLNIFASSTLGGGIDNGFTYYTIGSQTQGLEVQANTMNTVNFTSLVPSNGSITVNMSKTAWPPGYVNAFVIANHFDDGTAPAAPTGLTAALAGKNIGLAWTPHAYNETSYQVFRSAVDSLHFTQIATLPANSTTFTDTAFSGTTQYFYRVNATNAVGSSGYSNVASVTSPTRIPQIAAIADATVNNGQTATINVTATDDPSVQLTLTASNLPSFATFVDNGNGTGTITVTPPAGAQGIFSNVTVTVTDQYDSSRSTSFTIYVVDPALNYTYVNMTTPTYIAPAPWNNFVAGYIPGAGYYFPNLKDQTGANTGITITLTDAWSYVGETGMKRRNGSDVFPEKAMAGSFYATDNNIHRITLTGLDPNKAYNFLFFASHFTSESTLTNFTANGQTVSLDGSQNSNKTAQLNGITPDASGTVVISCQKASSAVIGMISALVIESYTPGSTTPIAPADLRVLDFRKTGTIPLQWQDRASNETGYEVWRAPHGGSYTLLKSLPANSTTYTDSALALDVAYDYVVRAKGATTNSVFSNPVMGYTYSSSVYVFFNRTWAPPFPNYPVPGAPWNNLFWVYQSLNTQWNNFKDENGLLTNIGMLQPNEWDEVDQYGLSTGNNSGVYPDLAMSQGWLNFPGTVSYVTLTGLDATKLYDITVFASCTDAPSHNASGLYTINGQSGVLNAYLNTSGTLTFFNMAPDAFGNMNVGLKVYDSSYSSFAIVGNLAIKSHTPAAGSASTAPASTIVSNVVSATANNLSVTTTSNATDAKPLQAFPNPFNDFFNLNVPATSGDNVLVTITDVNGKTVYSQRFENLFDGNNLLRIQPSEALPTGAYFVKVIYTNSGEQKVLQLLKNRK